MQTALCVAAMSTLLPGQSLVKVRKPTSGGGQRHGEAWLHGKAWLYFVLWHPGGCHNKGYEA
jgi:hypothetical protein